MWPALQTIQAAGRSAAENADQIARINGFLATRSKKFAAVARASIFSASAKNRPVIVTVEEFMQNKQQFLKTCKSTQEVRIVGSVDKRDNVLQQIDTMSRAIRKAGADIFFNEEKILGGDTLLPAFTVAASGSPLRNTGGGAAEPGGKEKCSIM